MKLNTTAILRVLSFALFILIVPFFLQSCGGNETPEIDCNNVTIEVVITKTDAICSLNNGAINILATGGVGNFQYNINNGSFQELNTFKELLTGTYTVTVKDKNGCTAQNTVEIGDVNTLSFETTVSNADCSQANGSVIAVASGGDGSYMYKLENGDFQNTGTFENLASGTYQITVKDEMGCSSSSKEVAIDETNGLILSTSVVDADCSKSNGSVSISVTGGENYSYQLNEGTSQTSEIFNNLAVGDYIVTVKSGSCIQETSITISEVNNLNFEYSVVNAGCTTEIGAINISATNGDGNYMYKIMGGDFQSSNQLINLPSDNYTVVLADGGSCEDVTGDVYVPSGVSYKNTVANIYEIGCAVSDCHVAGTGRFELTSLAKIQEAAANTKVRIESGNMPPEGASLTLEQKKAIICWIDDGAMDN